MLLQSGRLDAGAGEQVFGISVAELAVLGGPGDVEIDVAGGLVGEASIDQ